MPLMPCIAVLIGVIGDAWLREVRPRWSVGQSQRWIGGIATVTAAIYLGPVLSFQARRCDDIAGQIATLKSQLPDGESLCSFDQLHHGFLYHYGEPVRLLPVPTDVAAIPDDLTYFAVHTYKKPPAAMPFAWEPVALISCDRFVKGEPRDRIYIGRRIGPTTDVATVKEQPAR